MEHNTPCRQQSFHTVFLVHSAYVDLTAVFHSSKQTGMHVRQQRRPVLLLLQKHNILPQWRRPVLARLLATRRR